LDDGFDHDHRTIAGKGEAIKLPGRYASGDQDGTIYFIDSGQIKLPMLSSGKRNVFR